MEQATAMLSNTERAELNKEYNVEKTMEDVDTEKHKGRRKDVLLEETKQGNADRICNLTKQS